MVTFIGAGLGLGVAGGPNIMLGFCWDNVGFWGAGGGLKEKIQ